MYEDSKGCKLRLHREEEICVKRISTVFLLFFYLRLYENKKLPSARTGEPCYTPCIRAYAPNITVGLRRRLLKNSSPRSSRVIFTKQLQHRAHTVPDSLGHPLKLLSPSTLLFRIILAQCHYIVKHFFLTAYFSSYYYIQKVINGSISPFFSISLIKNLKNSKKRLILLRLFAIIIKYIDRLLL